MSDKEMITEYRKNVSEVIEPKFKDSTELSTEQLTDPDMH